MYVFTEQRLEDSLEPSVLKQETVVFVYLRIFRKFHMKISARCFRFVGISVLRVYEQHPASLLLFPPEPAVLEL